ncbi:MAG: hypothetical protein NC319_03315 [Butyricicoccus sp.]|nr:hypothetical protein [Butyricicoccus sp.]
MEEIKMSFADELRALLLQEERWEIIFRKINGEYVMDFCEEVKDELSDGELGKLIQQAYLARDRIADKLGVDAAINRDFCVMTDGFEDYARVCAKLMYQYGYQDGAKGI